MLLPFRKILYPTDFSDPSCTGVRAAAELAAHFDAELIVLHVVSPIPIAQPPFPGVPGGNIAFDVPLYQNELIESSRKRLDELVARRVPQGVRVRKEVTTGDHAYEILRTAEEEKADLIVIPTRGRSGWRRFMFGSVAEKVIKHASLPVLTIYCPPETSPKERKK